MPDPGPQLADQLQSSLLRSRGIDHRWVLPALLPLLAQGQPVIVADLARASGRAEQDVQQALSGQGDLETRAGAGRRLRADAAAHRARLRG